MTLPPLTYLTVDSVSEGIGLSQVVRYVERLARRGLDVTLHSFEQHDPDPAVAARLHAAGARWRPHRFRGAGSAGGALRVAHGAALVAGADLVHARSDLAAASAMLAGRRAWVWDFRGFWREQRIAQALLRPGSAPDRAMRRVEAASARRCKGIVTLTEAAVAVLEERHGREVAAKATVISTCVDLGLFCSSPLPDGGPVRLLLAGTLNRLYDVPAMLKLVERVASRCPAELTVLTSEPSPWDGQLRARGLTPASAPPAEMPERIGAHHAGLSVLRDVGASNRGAVPTKLAEFLACGRPVVVNAGLGDMDRLLAAYDCGVVLAGPSDEAIDVAAAGLLRLLADRGTPARCRSLAEEHFDVERGVDRLVDLYHRVVAQALA